MIGLILSGIIGFSLGVVVASVYWRCQFEKLEERIENSGYYRDEL